MKTATTLLAVVLLGGVGAGSYWLGLRSQAAASAGPATSASATSATSTTSAASAASAAPKLLYYRNPMGLADTSPTPKKDSMGMDYIAVYAGEDGSGTPQTAGEAPAANTLRISTEKIQKLGVRTETASLRLLGRTVRAAGRVEPDERRVSVIAPKFEGYVEKLLVNVTGQSVVKGQPLFEAYSPELVSAQREYAIAVQGQQAMRDAGGDAQASMRQLAESSLAHLRHWELAPDQLAALIQTGQPQRNVAFLSPVTGVVTDKKALLGMRFMPGDALYQVTDLSSVWVIADLPEQDIGAVKVGAMARITLTAYPNERFDGRVTYVYPSLKPETRTVPVRVELANPGGRLKPAMFAQVELAIGTKTPVLSVPESAVIDTGTRRIVLVQLKQGRFEPREVVLGARGENWVEIVKGVRDGEEVVVAANFLIDAESNLKAAISGFGAPAATASPSPTAPAKPAAPARPPASGAGATPHSGH